MLRRIITRLVGLRRSLVSVRRGLGFYSKPYCSATTAALGADGSFRVLLTTEGIDRNTTFIAERTLLQCRTRGPDGARTTGGGRIPCVTSESGPARDSVRWR